jgi:hypothetical protein
MENSITSKHLCTKAKCGVREIKCTSWETLVSSLSSLPILVLSGKMSGGYYHTSGISVGGNAITSQVDIVNTPGTHFTSVFCSNNYNPSFKLLKETTKALLLNFASWLTELYSAEFHMAELLVALHPYHNMAPGPDGIHNQMLSQLPPTGKELLLSVCNRLWMDSSSCLESSNNCPDAQTRKRLLLPN